MANKDSVRYTVLFATAVCVVCALMVAVAAVVLAPTQEANARQYMQKNVLLAAGLVEPGSDLSDAELRQIFEQRIEVRLVDFAAGAAAAGRPHRRRRLRPAPRPQRPGAEPRRAAQPGRHRAGAELRRRLLRQAGERFGPGRAGGAGDRGPGDVGHGLRLHRAGARRQHRAGPGVLRPEGDARARRRDRQPEVAGAVARPQGLRRAVAAQAGGDQGPAPAPPTATRTASTACPAPPSPATRSRGWCSSGCPTTATGAG